MNKKDMLALLKERKSAVVSSSHVTTDQKVYALSILDGIIADLKDSSRVRLLLGMRARRMAKENA